MPPAFPDARLLRAGISAARVDALRAAYNAMGTWEQGRFRALVASRPDEILRRTYDPAGAAPAAGATTAQVVADPALLTAVQTAILAAHDTDSERETFIPARLGDAALRAALIARPNLPGGYESGMTRRTAYAVGGSSGGNGTNNGVNAATFRYPFRLPVSTTRWRLHVRNYDSRSDIAYTGAVTFTGAWIGQHALASGAHTGAFTAAPVQALTGFATPANGSEYVSGWVTDPAAQFTPYAEHLLSVGWTCAAAQTNVRTVGNAWYSGTNSALGGQQAATGLAFIGLGILDVWIEFEYASPAPIVAFLTDSLGVGVGSSRPLYDSWPSRFGLAHGVNPVHYGYSGTTLDEWTTTTAYKWTKFTTGLTKPDAAVLAIGGNNIFNGETAAAVQAKMLTHMDAVRSVLGINTLYLATVTPRNNATANETNRQTYNNWLRGLPGGATGVLDFDPVIRDPANAANILAVYNSGDNTHLTTAGYAAMTSRAVGAPLVRVA